MSTFSIGFDVPVAPRTVTLAFGVSPAYYLATVMSTGASPTSLGTVQIPYSTPADAAGVPGVVTSVSASVGDALSLSVQLFGSNSVAIGAAQTANFTCTPAPTQQSVNDVSGSVLNVVVTQTA